MMSLNSPCPPPGPSSWSDTRAMLAGWGTPRVGPKPVGRGFPWRAPARHQHLQGGSRERHPNSTGRTRRDSAWEAQAGTAACRSCPCRGTPYGTQKARWHRGVPPASLIRGRESQASGNLGPQGAPPPHAHPVTPEGQDAALAEIPSPGWHQTGHPRLGEGGRAREPRWERGKGGRACSSRRRGGGGGGGRDRHVWEKPRSPSPGRGEPSAAGRDRTGPALGRGQLPARPPRSPGGDFDPAGGRACPHLLPAGCAAAAAAPPALRYPPPPGRPPPAPAPRSRPAPAPPPRPARRCAGPPPRLERLGVGE